MAVVSLLARAQLSCPAVRLAGSWTVQLAGGRAVARSVYCSRMSCPAAGVAVGLTVGQREGDWGGGVADIPSGNVSLCGQILGNTTLEVGMEVTHCVCLVSVSCLSLTSANGQPVISK